MKKITFFAAVIAAMAFTACGGNKSAQTAEETDSIKAFEQEQVEAKIKLELENGNLTVGASRNVSEEEKSEEGKVIRQERYMGAMQRNFYVGEYITEEDIKAKFEDGVLKLCVPKKEAPKPPEKKSIMIEG